MGLNKFVYYCNRIDELKEIFKAGCITKEEYEEQVERYRGLIMNS